MSFTYAHGLNFDARLRNSKSWLNNRAWVHRYGYNLVSGINCYIVVLLKRVGVAMKHYEDTFRTQVVHIKWICKLTMLYIGKIA